MATKVFTFVFATLGLALLFACSAQPVIEERVASDKPPAFAEELPEGCKLGPVARVDGAEIYAVIDPAAPSSTEFVTLDEAMAQKLCTVKEVGEGGTVNTLKISNSGQKPIFCMAGDLVLGGQQDRILAESLVVVPNTNDQDIPVFCVEHGRWQTQEKDGANATTRSFNNDGERGQVDLNVKKAALESRNQSVVWEEVARNNSKLAMKQQPSSGTFRATFDDEATRAKIEKNFTTAQKLLGKGVVGFAVVCNGELVAMDVFESSDLCAKLSSKLLRSYVITGISGGYESNSGAAKNRDMYIQEQGCVFLDDGPERTITGEQLRSEDEEGRARAETLALFVRSIDFLINREFGAAGEELDRVLYLNPDHARAIALKVEVAEGTLATLSEAEFTQRTTTWTTYRTDARAELAQLVNASAFPAQSQNETRIRTIQRGADGTPPTETPPPPPAPVAANPNANTETRREYTKESVKYDCTDKKSGKVVQRSFLKR